MSTAFLIAKAKITEDLYYLSKMDKCFLPDEINSISDDLDELEDTIIIFNSNPSYWHVKSDQIQQHLQFIQQARLTLKKITLIAPLHHDQTLDYLRQIQNTFNTAKNDMQTQILLSTIWSQ